MTLSFGRAYNKDNNPDLSLSVGQYSTKFHLVPLDKVIEHDIEAGLVEEVPKGYFGAPKAD